MVTQTHTNTEVDEFRRVAHRKWSSLPLVCDVFLYWLPQQQHRNRQHSHNHQHILHDRLQIQRDRTSLIKGVMTWEIKFALIFWHMRGLWNIKTSCKFHSLKHPRHYKQNMYLNQACLYLRCKMTSLGHKHLHKHQLLSKTSTNINLLTIGPAHWRSVANGWHLITLNVSAASKANINYNHCRYLV